MTPSSIFATSRFEDLAARVRDVLNAHEDFLSATTARSPRAVGDAVETILGEQFQAILGEHCAEYSASFARRAMADLAFRDRQGLYYVVDVKTHRADASFSMPNLTSAERLVRFYEDDTNYFVLLLLRYELVGTHAEISDVTFVPIEFLDWSCLTVGALGWGQIQIANANHVRIRPHYPRRTWMLELCDVMLEFYPREIAKIEARVERFRQVRDAWQSRLA